MELIQSHPFIHLFIQSKPTQIRENKIVNTSIHSYYADPEDLNEIVLWNVEKITHMWTETETEEKMSERE